MEILASTEDVNANLDGSVIQATDVNTGTIQVSVARVVKGYLARIVDRTILALWQTPVTTPDIIREVAAKLIASQLYFVEAARSGLEISDQHVSQRLYNEALAILNQIIVGDIPLPDVPETPSQGFTNLDFFPRDATDRAFTLGMNL